MSEVDWVWGGEITAEAKLSDLLQAQAGIRPAWVEELHWLASPRAVGRYNLLPHARLVFLPSLQSSAALEQVAIQLLEPVQLSLEQVTWQADSGQRVAGGAVQLINKLVKELEKNKGSYALLVSLAMQGLALGTLIERI